MSANGVELVWQGKRTAPLPVETPPVLRCVERVGSENSGAGVGRLIQGDNLAAMIALKSERVEPLRLIYLDPPFFTGTDWFLSEAHQNRSESKRAAAFSDAWNGDLGSYLQWLCDRLTLCRELLADDGVLYLHLNWQAAHYAKIILDEIFGVTRFQNEIVWCYREAINSKKRWNRKHDTILMYSKGERFLFNADAVRDDYADTHVKKYRLRDEKGPYRLMGRGITGSPLRSKRDLPSDYEDKYPGLTYRHYLGEGTLPVDYWLIDIENQASKARTGYPTQKPEALLERILLASSNPGDLVADFCCGSGTTLAVAQRLGRNWIGCDSGEMAIATARERLQKQANVAFSLETLSETSLNFFQNHP